MWAGWEGCGCMYVVVVGLSRIFKDLLLSIASLNKLQIILPYKALFCNL